MLSSRTTGVPAVMNSKCKFGDNDELSSSFTCRKSKKSDVEVLNAIVKSHSESLFTATRFASLQQEKDYKVTNILLWLGLILFVIQRETW